MINDPKIINEICKNIQNISKSQLKETIKEVDKIMSDLKENQDNPEISKEIIEKAKDLAKDCEGGYFNYRIIEKEDKWTDLDGVEWTEYYYEIHEVYYNGKDEIIAWTENPINVYFETYSDVRDTINHIKKASNAKILKLITKEDGDEELIELDTYMKDIK